MSKSFGKLKVDRLGLQLINEETDEAVVLLPFFMVTIQNRRECSLCLLSGSTTVDLHHREVKPETNNRFKINVPNFEFYMSTAPSVNKRSGMNQQTLPDEVMINEVDTLGNTSEILGHVDQLSDQAFGEEKKPTITNTSLLTALFCQNHVHVNSVWNLP